ncbi:MAG TPA: bifunctional phosphopantothenoylcysteine decarboxylase/phosphopantothenate--cysteine ligase CoaBC [Bacteroidales bacterium]|nr:bifunctional phosphopantothenoylcysteine decarboxylase/phosphopantothenate--cysteine ligase CoaBC [Bacteroidales bacterium]HPM93386.1 bifunctional phosphopantothenoylcysteine decarboxylase/phosphopantothenate--cysteine ligase CoaBC [Bacteroidales bacterium]
MLKGKKIVIGVTGSIAAFKVPALIRLFKKEGAEIKVMMTKAATDFVTPLTLSTLSENPVIIEPFDPVDGSWNSHVDLGRWADLYLLAPVSANTLAKMAGGIADNFFLTACLSAKCPVFFAPAMDLDMYKHPATMKNIQILQSYGNQLIEPSVGELASGLCGAGRMEEPENIFGLVKSYFENKTGPLSGKRVLVTAGPTHEAIDPVRYIGNHSSGLMGFSLAEQAAEAGAIVTLISGPTDLKLAGSSIERINVTSAAEMHHECLAASKESDIIIMAAAVADFRPVSTSSQKIKKSGNSFLLELIPTKDILTEISANRKPGQVIAGFALETENEIDHATEKLVKKNLDLIILNSMREEGSGFKTPTNKVSILFKSGQIKHYPLKSKKEVACDIIEAISSMI